MITSEAKMEFNVRKRLDELARGECSEDDFLQDVFIGPRPSPDAAWDVLAHIDQHYRRGHLSDELFRSIESKIARQALKDSHYGRTVDLIPETDVPACAPATAVAPAASPSTFELSVPVKPETQTPAAPCGIDDLCGAVLADRYVIEDVLGEGGMGRVFKALDRLRCDLPEPRRHVALKVLHQKISERPNLLAKLRREFFCAQSLSHQNIVNVYETGTHGDLAFFTMELLHGELLSAVIDRSRPKPVDRSYAFDIIRAIGAGLAHAHARNMVHADLKPQNVMIASDGEIRILDFGASRPSVRQRTSRPEMLCSVTPAYASCELLAGKPADPRDDLFSLACLAYELLTGRHPFDRCSAIQAREAGLKPVRPQGLSGRQWRTLRTGLAWRRADRALPVGEWVTRLTAESAEPPEGSDSASAAAPSAGTARRPGGAWWNSIGMQRLALWAGIAVVIGSLAVHGHRPQRRAAASAPADAPVAVGRQAAVRQIPAPAPQIQAAATPAAASTSAAGAAAATTAPAVRATSGRSGSAAADAPVARKPNVLSVVSFRLPSGQKFAEVRVRRPDAENGDGGFVWWTVAGSAVAGTDFVAQPPTSQSFSPGRRASNLFVRVLPNPSRTAPREFHVEIGKGGSDDISAPIARATIVIPGRP